MLGYFKIGAGKALWSDRTLRPRMWIFTGAGLLAAMLPPGVVHEGLAATAGTLFEAAPFVLVAAAVRGRVAARAAALLGCGCGPGIGPAALSLPAAALCWATFGPGIAVARFAAGVLVHAYRTRHVAHADEAAALDPLAELSAIALPAFVLACATNAVAGLSPAWFAHLPPGAGVALALAGGLAAGAIAPCATAAVALAAMVRSSFPFAAAAILLTAGLPSPLAALANRLGGATLHGAGRGYDARLGLGLLATACSALAIRGSSGLIHPRLVPLLWLTVPAAIMCLRSVSRTRTRFGIVAPVAMLATLVLGSPVPSGRAGTAALDGLYPGEAVTFTGVTTLVRGRVTLVRYGITCCRADATPFALTTNLPPAVPAGRWLSMRGTVARDAHGMFVRTGAWAMIPAPRDPFFYR